MGSRRPATSSATGRAWPTAPRLATAPAPPPPSGPPASGTGTNVQEAGVDEPDVVKTDGSLLVRIADGDLAHLRRDRATSPSSSRSAGRLPGLREARRDPARRRPRGRDRTERTRATYDRATAPPGSWSSTSPTRSDPASSTTRSTTPAWSPRASTASTVRLVVSAELPDLPFVEPRRWWRDEESALEKQPRDRPRQHDRGLAADASPATARPRQLLDCSDVERARRRGRARDARGGRLRPGRARRRGPAAASRPPPPSPTSRRDRMYLATDGWSTPGSGRRAVLRRSATPASAITTERATCTRSRSTATETTYLASGEVDGRDRRPLVDGRVRRRAARGGRADRAHRQLQLDRHPPRGGRRPGRDRPRRPARA